MWIWKDASEGFNNRTENFKFLHWRCLKGVISGSFCAFSGFSIYRIPSTVFRDSFTSSCSCWLPLTPFSCLLALARISSNVQIAVVKAANMLFLYHVEEVPFYFWFPGCFYREKRLGFVKDVLFCIDWDDHVFFPSVLSTWGVLCWLIFSCVEQPCIPKINPVWSWCVTFFICCWVWCASILSRILHLSS